MNQQLDTTSTGVLAHGLHAIAAHIEERQLPAPHAIDLPGRAGFDGLTITVFRESALKWMGGDFAVDDITEAPAKSNDRQWVRADGRLPDSGVRVRVQWLDRISEPVCLVAGCDAPVPYVLTEKCA